MSELWSAEKPYSFEEAIEIADIRKELLKLANSGILPKRSSDACAQAAWLLIAIREIVLSIPYSGFTCEQAESAMTRLKDIMVQQQEG